MKKNVAVFFLSLGGLLIIILLSIFFYINHVLKRNIQVSLNTYLKEAQTKIQDLEFVPFECSGLKNIECKSQKITLHNIITLSDIRLTIQDMQDQNALNFSLDIDKIDFLEHKYIQDIRSFLNLSLITIDPNIDIANLIAPNSAKCKVENKLKDQQIDNLTNCKIISPQMKYALQIKTAQKPSELKNGLKETILANFHLYKTDKNTFNKNLQIKFYGANLMLQPLDLKKRILDQVEKQNKKFDEKNYEKALELAKNLGTYAINIGFQNNIPYKQKLLDSLTGIINILNEKNKGMEFQIQPVNNEYVTSIQQIQTYNFDPKHFNLNIKEIQ